MTFISRFKDATIGFSGYVRLARDKAGGFGYVALLLLIVMAVSAWITTVHVSRAIATAMPELQQMPAFALKGGEFRFDGPMPYRLPGSGRSTMIIDTTGQTTPDAFSREAPGSLLLTRDAMYQVQPGGLHTTRLHSLQAVSLSQQDLLTLLPRLPRLVPFLYLLGYVAQLGFKALNAMILAAVALIYGRATGRPVSFDLGFKLGLYAMTMPIIIQWIWPSFTTLSLAGFGIWWGLAVLYLIMGLRAQERTEAA